MIVLDTNQLQHAAFPHGPILGMLRKIAEIHQRPLALPEMVVVEHVAHHRHEIERTLTAARKSLTSLGRSFGQDLASQLDALSSEAAAQKRRAELESAFTILPTPAGAAEEALSREANRLPPAEQVWSDNKGDPVKAHGARDAAIWLTLLDTARTAEHDVWFVSLDKDFGNDDFHPQLRQEAQDTVGVNAERLKLLHGGVDQLLDELADRATTPKNLKAMLQNPAVTEAADIALNKVQTFFDFLPHDATIWTRWASGVALYDFEIKQSKAYTVDDRLWVSAHVNCRANKTYQVAWPARQTGVELAMQTVETAFAFEATMLLEVDNSAIRSADVVAMGPIFGKQANLVGAMEPVFVAAGNVPDGVEEAD